MQLHDFDAIVDRRGRDSIKWNLYGEEVFPLWVADSDFTAPEPVIKALAERERGWGKSFPPAGFKGRALGRRRQTNSGVNCF